MTTGPGADGRGRTTRMVATLAEPEGNLFELVEHPYDSSGGDEAWVGQAAGSDGPRGKIHMPSGHRLRPIRRGEMPADALASRVPAGGP